MGDPRVEVFVVSEGLTLPTSGGPRKFSESCHSVLLGACLGLQGVRPRFSERNEAANSDTDYGKSPIEVRISP